MLPLSFNRKSCFENSALPGFSIYLNFYLIQRILFGEFYFVTADLNPSWKLSLFLNLSAHVHPLNTVANFQTAPKMTSQPSILAELLAKKNPDFYY